MYGTLYWVLYNDEQNGHNTRINYSQMARENQESHTQKMLPCFTKMSGGK